MRRKTPQTVTIKDLARELGISHQAVSAALFPGRTTTKVSEATQQRVQETARRMGYRKDIAATSLRRRQSFLIGTLFSGVNYRYAGDFWKGLQEVTSEHEYAPILFTHGDTQEELRFLKRCQDRQVEALIVNCAIDPDGGTNAAVFEELRETGFPIVEVFGRVVSGAPSVNIGYAEAGRRAVELLVEAGHEEIVLFTHEQYRRHETDHTWLFWNAGRYAEGYAEAVAQAGIESQVITHTLSPELARPGALYQGALGAAKRIFAQAPNLTAIVCLSDEEAAAILTVVDRLQIKVAENFHVVTLGGYLPIHGNDQRLTTLFEQVTDIGQEAARRAFDLIEGKPAESITIPPGETPYAFQQD